MAKDTRPTLHMIAGPNGAGKSTLYRNELADRYPDAEFVNADDLARQHYGHAAVTLEESKMGQKLAEDRRRALMAEHKSLVTESTFSHPSKLALLRDAKAAGYRIAVYHVNVYSANVSVARVADRVHDGGHPVPEDKIRERYERNQQLIREAVKLADVALVYDNSKLGTPHQLAFMLQRGEPVHVSDRVPKWARELYAPELKQFSAARQNRPAASFAEAEAIVHAQLHPNARTFIARAGGRYAGEIIGETDLHVLQRIGKDSAVAHFTNKLDKALAVGDRATVTYDQAGHAKVQRVAERGPYAALADAWRRDPAKAAKAHPEHAEDMAKATAMLAAARTAAAQRGLSRQQADAVTGKLQQRLAGDLEHGRPIPGAAVRARAGDRGPER